MTTVAIIGAGTIGLSWAALYAAHGHEVRISDPRPDLDELVEHTIQDFAEFLPDSAGLVGRIQVVSGIAEAVAGVELIQENGPERLELKQKLFDELAEYAPDDAVLASSSSGIPASKIAASLPDQVAARLLIAHPFNPPHLVPLVEIVPGERTSERTVAWAIDWYRALGKVPVRERKEVAGFVANRLQSAILREATDLVLRGVVDTAELDTIVRNSLGGRYAAVGPFESFHLGGGPGGIRHMFAHLGTGMMQQWHQLGDPDPSAADIDELVGQTENAYGADEVSYHARARRRDRLQVALTETLQDESE